MAKKINTPALRKGAPSEANLSLVPAEKGVNVLTTLFRSKEEAATARPKDVVVKSMSPMLKPAQWPAGAVLVGKFVRLFETHPGNNEDGTPKLGEGIEIVPEGSPVGVSLPAVAVLRTALEISGKGKEATSPFIGRIIEVELLGKVPSKKGNDAWNFLVSIHPEKK
jgi:hypothetical protein